MAPPYDVIVLGLGFGLGGTGGAVAHDAGAHPAGKAATRRYSHIPDEHCVLTRHPAPGSPETVTVACGFSGHGFKFLPVVGEIVTDLALTGATAHPIELFDPRRPAAAAA